MTTGWGYGEESPEAAQWAGRAWLSVASVKPWQPEELWVSKSWYLGPVCIVGFLSVGSIACGICGLSAGLEG